MISIVDYGMGNLGSLLNMFKRVGTRACIVSDPRCLQSASKIVLPGVGAFDAAMQCINSIPGLKETLEFKALVEQIPILGVCLGMQLLTEQSEEGILPGLGWIMGRTYRFPRGTGLKVPHMGWNSAHPSTPNPLTVDLGEDPRYYFVHSYHVLVTNSQHSIMKTKYGIEFDSAIAKDNILGVQFHPEKSHRFGMQILNNFAAL